MDRSGLDSEGRMIPICFTVVLFYVVGVRWGVGVWKRVWIYFKNILFVKWKLNCRWSFARRCSGEHTISRPSYLSLSRSRSLCNNPEPIAF